jgi:hypothetical protein
MSRLELDCEHPSFTLHDSCQYFLEVQLNSTAYQYSTLLPLRLIGSHEIRPRGGLPICNPQALIQSLSSIVTRILAQQLVLQQLLRNWRGQEGFERLLRDLDEGRRLANDLTKLCHDSIRGVVVSRCIDLLSRTSFVGFEDASDKFTCARLGTCKCCQIEGPDAPISPATSKRGS